MKALSIRIITMRILIGLLVVFMVGCGQNSDVVSNTRIGQLIGDDGMSNLYYTTETHSGNTNSTGEFVYEPGENIAFYDGDILIGKTKATDVISSFSLSGVTLSAEAL